MGRIIQMMGGYLFGLIRHFSTDFPVSIWPEPLLC